jgi:hypothetical protein
MYLRKEMKKHLPEGLCRYVPQPLVAFLVTGLAFGLVALTAAHTGSIFVISARDFVLLILVVAVVLAEHFPIHVRENTKVQMTTAPIYLIAVLYPPAIAAAAAGFAMLTGELTVRRQKGNYPSDIATDVGRWMIAALAGSEAIRVLAPNIGPMGALAAAAFVMWAWDMLSAPATLSPISGENPLRVIVSTVKEAGPAEGAQYVIGILAAVLSEVQPWTMALLVLPLAYIQIATKRSKEMQDGTQMMLENMADTVDLRDTYTGGHSRRVTGLVEAILAELSLSGPDVRLIVTSARLHDIGKISVPDAVLHKPGKLDADEWSNMAAHPEVGADLLARHPGFRRGVEIVRHHHEAWDGSGYPHKLKGTEIPFGARVIAVADSFDAMTSDRPYRSGMSCSTAIRILREGRGAQWDPQIVDAFVHSISARLESETGPQLRIVRPEEEGKGNILTA